MTRASQIRPYVAIACGGTGGHLFPGLAVADHLVQHGVAVSLLVSAKDVDQNAVKSVRGMEVITLPAVALQSGSRLAFVRGFVQSWRAARRQFRARRPEAVLAMGGFTSAPPVLAARGVGAKTYLHESNTIPGRANRWLARVVDHAFIGFPQAAARLHARETTVTGTPVRAEFHARDAGDCRLALGFDPARPVVLIMGGSQGATGINELVRASLPQLAARLPQAQWLHLAGARDVEPLRKAYADLKLKAAVHPFLQEMGLALAAATVAVSRAGASSLAELAALQLPAVLVPFPHAADNHQWYNARAFVESGAAFLFEQAGALSGRLEAMLADLIENPATREKTRDALGQWHSPRAAEQIAGIILTVMHKRASIAPHGDGTRLENHSINLNAIT